MRENRTSGSMRGRRRRAVTYRACVLLYMQGKETVGVLSLRCGIIYRNASTQRPDLCDRAYSLSV